MRLFISGDSWWEARLGPALGDLVDLKYRQYFEERDYGTGLSGITVIFMCHQPEYLFKRRLRFSRKDKVVSMDIMLDLAVMQPASPAERKREIAQRLFDEVPVVMSKYKIDDFKTEAFIGDFRAWIDGIGWR